MAAIMSPAFARADAVPLFRSSDGVHFGLSPAQMDALRARSEGFRNLLDDASPPSSATAAGFPRDAGSLPPASAAVIATVAEDAGLLECLFALVAEHEELPDVECSTLARLASLLQATDKYVFRVEAHLIRSILRARLRHSTDVKGARAVYAIAAHMGDELLAKDASRVAVLTLEPLLSSDAWRPYHITSPWPICQSPPLPEYYLQAMTDLSDRRERRLAAFPSCIKDAESAARASCARTGDAWQYRRSHDFTGLWYRVRTRLRQRRFGQRAAAESRAALADVLRQPDIVQPWKELAGDYFCQFCAPCYVDLVRRLDVEMSALLDELDVMTI